MEEPERGKNLRDYNPTKPEPVSLSLPRGEANAPIVTARHPSVGETRGTRSSMGPQTVGEAGPSSGGAFCSIYEDPENPGDWYLRGGSVPGVGDKNFSVPAFLLPSADNDYRIYIVVNVEVNRTDDNQFFMPDIKTSSDVSLTMASTTGAYPSNTLPTVATGLGVIHLLVGEVIVADGVPSLNYTGCGSFHIESCLGSLTYRSR